MARVVRGSIRIYTVGRMYRITWKEVADKDVGKEHRYVCSKDTWRLDKTSRDTCRAKLLLNMED